MLFLLLQLPRWYYLLRYHRTQQFVARLRGIIRRRWRSRFGVRGYSNSLAVQPRNKDNPALTNILQHKLSERLERDAIGRADKIRQRQFCFLNETVDFSAGIDWRVSQHPEIDALWKFHLHYQEYLLDLAASANHGKADPADSNALVWNLVEDWIRGNPTSNTQVFGDAWHPFCISRRLPVWILLWSAHEPPADVQPIILSSIANQADFLADNLESDLGGNHLLENLHALVFSGCFLGGEEPARWLRIAEERLSQELAEQLTSHGEHFERSPMYHAFMLEIFLNMRELTKPICPVVSKQCDEAVEAMATFLKTVVHPDQEIPLFSDSVLGQATAATALMNRAGINQKTSVDDLEPASRCGGYWVFRDQEDFLVFDAEIGFPDHLPAHGHADLLNFEASLGGQRVFVDSGVCTYGAGEMRKYCRSTAAHNALEVDGLDQFEMWSRFRVGYRGWTSELEVGQVDDFHWARATHNAYRRVRVPVVGRWLACRPGGPWLCVDWANGHGKHSMTHRLHLHPSVTAQQLDDARIQIHVDQLAYELQGMAGVAMTIEKGWYCSEFGKREDNLAIALRSEMPQNSALGWALSWPGQAGQADLQYNDAGALTVDWDGPGKLHHVVTTQTK